MSTLDEDRFKYRATAGQDRLDVAARTLQGCSGPVGTEPAPARAVPRRDVDGLAHVLHEEVLRLRSELADTKARLMTVERLLAERWGTA